MNTPKKLIVRVDKIHIKNYKKITDLVIDFPPPEMPDDLDITVIGSANGTGKTSILECICFGLSSTVTVNFKILINDKKKTHIKQINPDTLILSMNKITGVNPNPLLEEKFLFFNSHRKILEHSISLSALTEQDNWKDPVSLFKQKIIYLVMQKAQLFSDEDEGYATKALDQLNKIMMKFAGAEIGKIKNTKKMDSNAISILEKSAYNRGMNLNQIDHQMDVLVKKNETTFDFNDLSSGQKEIISMLFLIWEETQDQAKVVIIDEPELHLNPEWQAQFIRTLKKIAPHNQYIFATHSSLIADRVKPYQRGLLEQ